MNRTFALPSVHNKEEVQQSDELYCNISVYAFAGVSAVSVFLVPFCCLCLCACLCCASLFASVIR